MNINSANALTVLRIFLSVVFFVLIGYLNESGGSEIQSNPSLIQLGDIAFLIFLVSLGTDYLDGILARRSGTVSPFGRYADPMADKILICGSLIMLLGFPSSSINELLKEWMVVLVIGREFVVQGIRAGLEKKGIEFPALTWGKVKMVIQSIAIGGLLLYGLHFSNVYWFQIVVTALVWLMVVSTAISGGVYLYYTRKLLKQSREFSG